MQNKTISQKAFSLIEVSIVLLIIGILVAGVTQGSRLVRASRLQTAQNLTVNSPVAGIPNLSAWWETSLESSFLAAEAVDSTAISTWYDNNPQSSYKNNLSQTTATNKPTFYENVFNGAIPAIRFDGTNDFMPFDGTPLIGTPYTIFIVEQRRVANAGIMTILGGTNNGTTNGNMHLGYRSNTTVTHAQFSNDVDYTITAFSSIVPRIHTFWLSTTSGKKYYLNGGTTADATSAGQTATMVSYSGSSIGRSVWLYYNGDIAEIIIFTRSLKDEERQSIETYLSKKYGIGIS